jgi:hypothetical protein
MVRHVERKAISLQIHNQAKKSPAQHGIGRPPVWRVGNPLTLSVIVSFIDSLVSIFRLPGTTSRHSRP